MQQYQDLSLKFKKTPVFKTVYNWIQKCIIKKYRRDLLQPQNKSDKRCTEYKENNKIANGEVHISKHPEIINNWLEKGHFEIDLIVSKREHKGGLLTLVDGMTRFGYAIHFENKKMENINDKLLELKNTHNFDIKSITRDNGTEFNLLYKFENTKVYFCNPYSSWERGTNENFNGLIRRWLKKGIIFSNVTKKELKLIIGCINNMPRKILVFRFSSELYI